MKLAFESYIFRLRSKNEYFESCSLPSLNQYEEIAMTYLKNDFKLLKEKFDHCNNSMPYFDLDSIVEIHRFDNEKYSLKLDFQSIKKNWMVE